MALLKDFVESMRGKNENAQQKAKSSVFQKLEGIKTGNDGKKYVGFGDDFDKELNAAIDLYFKNIQKQEKEIPGKDPKIDSSLGFPERNTPFSNESLRLKRREGMYDGVSKLVDELLQERPGWLWDQKEKSEVLKPYIKDVLLKGQEPKTKDELQKLFPPEKKEQIDELEVKSNKSNNVTFEDL